MEKLEFYNKVRAVPIEAQKKITGGNINGFTDINPMWRIKTLTEHFGMCGIGWYPEIVKQWLETGSDGRTAAFCNINLYIKVDDEWSKAINGTGGSMFTDVYKSGAKTSDECYKMAYTDALSVCCKLLGIGADIYWDKDKTKYDKTDDKKTDKPDVEFTDNSEKLICEECKRKIKGIKTSKNELSAEQVASISKEKYGRALCEACSKKEKEKLNADK